MTGGAGSAQTELGDTPLHLAASHGNAQVVSHRSCSQLPPRALDDFSCPFALDVDGIPSSDRHVCLAWVWRQVAKELIMAGADPTIKNKAKPVLPHKGTTDPEIYELAKLVHAFEDSNQVGTCACKPLSFVSLAHHPSPPRSGPTCP